MNKRLPYRELDELGEGIVLSYLKRSGMSQSLKCVDIEGLANSLGLQVTYEKFAEEDTDKIGFLADGITPLRVLRAGKVVPFVFPLGTIVLDTLLLRDNESGRCRFTIAHEAAHFILDKHYPQPQFHRIYDAQQAYSLQQLREHFNIMETEADKLAAALLMPRFLVDRTITDLNNGNHIRVFGGNVLSSGDRIMIDRMASQLGVSFTALFIRLRQFHLLEYRPLEEYLSDTLWKGATL